MKFPAWIKTVTLTRTDGILKATFIIRWWHPILWIFVIKSWWAK